MKDEKDKVGERHRPFPSTDGRHHSRLFRQERDMPQGSLLLRPFNIFMSSISVDPSMTPIVYAATLVSWHRLVGQSIVVHASANIP